MVGELLEIVAEAVWLARSDPKREWRIVGVVVLVVCVIAGWLWYITL